MVIEIRKVNFVNKGAELMLYAILEKMKKEFPQARFAMAPRPILAPYDKRITLGLYQKPDIYKYGIQFGKVFNFVPKIIRDMYGIVIDKEIDVVLDAAGFEYSDQWSPKPTLALASLSNTRKKYGVKTILLSQAFGPFSTSEIKKAMSKVADNADLIFARENISYDYLTEVVGKRKNIKLAPDFTNIISGILPDDFDVKNNRFCIVPNYRMIDKTTKKESEAYLPFIIKCTKYLIEKNQKPFILVHEGEKDMMLAQKINEAVGGRLPIIKETHPLKIKGILGTCEGTIGSRFHGLVSALSQGVPSLATGWSHKYKMLFEDYGFEDGLLDVLASDNDIYRKLDLIIDKQSHEMIKNLLINKSKELKEKTEEMWDDVINIIKQKKETTK